jgi:general secretion pathway protein D
MVSNGETAVIGGLTKDSWVKGMSGVPILSDIPLLGLLFKGERVRKIKKDVIIFITPTIVED